MGQRTQYTYEAHECGNSKPKRARGAGGSLRFGRVIVLALRFETVYFAALNVEEIAFGWPSNDRLSSGFFGTLLARGHIATERGIGEPIIGLLMRAWR